MTDRGISYSKRVYRNGKAVVGSIHRSSGGYEVMISNIACKVT